MSKTILIADTEENTRDALKLILEDHATLVTVASQAHALQILSNANNVGIVFMGLHDESGINTEIFASIRDRFASLTLIAIGNARMEEHALEAVRQGASGYMVKPFRSEEVLTTARKAIGF